MNRHFIFILAATLLLGLASCNKTNDNYPYNTRYLPVVLEGSEKWSILDINTGELVAKDAFTATPSAIVSDMFFVLNDEGTYDYYNVADVKHPVNAKHYGSVTEFSADGYAVASVKGENLCVINKQCEPVAQLGDSIIECSIFCRGLAIVHTTNNKYGYINTSGEMVIPARYDKAEPFMFDDYALVMSQHQDSIIDISIIDKKGSELFQTNSTMYRPVTSFFKRGVIPAAKRDTVVCLNGEGKEVENPFKTPEAIVKASYDNAVMEGSGNFIVIRGEKMGVCNASGDSILPIKYKNIIDLNDERYLVSEDGVTHFLIDKKGNKVGNLKIIHANGTPNAVAVRGYIDATITGANMLTLFDENQVTGVPAGAKVGDFYQLLDGTHPEQYEGKTNLANFLAPLRVTYEFAGPIVSNNEFNFTTPVKFVSIEFDANSYDNGTEAQLDAFLTQNMGRTGFVSRGDNVFVSDRGTAISKGFDKGIFMLCYYMNVADAVPIAKIPRK
ncbi:MAG: WG repeat-containing protein [Muribaculaceae bacterium]|nr:WG repeat-containing protein [Muribaculaceae bacterium]